MLPSTAGRILRPSCCAASSTTPARLTAAHHQRRHSSSKTSVPPDGSKRIAPTQQAQPGTRKSRSKNGRSPVASRNNKDTFVPLSKLYPDLPDPVKATTHLRREDVAIMGLFAEHRPLSVTHLVPPSVTEADFSALFEPRSKREPWRQYNDTITQLTSVVEGLENASVEQPEEAIQVIHLDPSGEVADAIIDPYNLSRMGPPPPPQPAPDFLADGEIADTTAYMTKKQSMKRKVKGKSWQTTITVTEFLDGKGHRTFRANSTPIIRIASGEARIIEEPQGRRQPSIKQPFLERMRSRQQRMRDSRAIKIRAPTTKPKMLLISVKRQRKAKMKKHKLKKLRKRTRNLRRKLNKI